MRRRTDTSDGRSKHVSSRSHRPHLIFWGARGGCGTANALLPAHGGHRRERFQLPADTKRQVDPESTTPWYYSADFLNIEFWGPSRGCLLPHSVKIEQAWRERVPYAARLQRRGDLGPGACPQWQGIRASMAYVVDDLRTLKDLRK